MRHSISLFNFLFPFFFFPLSVFSQINGLNYQGAVRDDNGAELQNTSIDVRIGVVSGNPGGTLEWEETHATGTNEFGLFALIIGEGTSTGNGAQPNFGSVDWGSADHFLKVEVDAGNGYEDMGTNEFNYVPYALFAENVANADDADADPTNELIDSLAIDGAELQLGQAGTLFTVDLGTLNDSDWVRTPTVVYNDTTDIGIGTQTPLANLHVSGPGDASTNVLHIDNALGRDAIVADDSAYVAIGHVNPHSNLHVRGSQAGNIDVVEGPATVDIGVTHYFFIGRIGNGDISANLPPAASCPGRYYNFKADSNNNTSTLFVVPQSGELIDGVLGPRNLGNQYQLQQIVVVSDGQRWWIVSK